MSISSSLTESSSMESHKSDSSQNYITVIPVEYPRSRVYSQTPEYLVDQYSEYLRDRSRDEYLRGDYNINADAQFDDVGPLYTVSQRFDRESKPHITGSTYGSLSHDVEREKSHLVSSGYSSAVHDIDREREKPHIIPNTYGSLSHDLDRDREKSHILTNSYSSSNHDIERDKHLITNSYGSLSHDIDRDRDMKPHLAANNFSSMSHDLDREREWERPHHTHIAATSEVNQSSTKEGSLSKDGPHEEQKSVQVSLIQSLKICVYLMSRVVLQMELEDGAATTVHDLIQAILQEEELGLPRVAANIFSLWMCSGLLEIQLKPFHKPFEVRKRWPALLKQYCSASESRMERDEPVLSFQRNVFFSKRDEEKIKDQKLLDLLYEEARFNILEGRYPCEVSHYIMLGGIQARIELGPYIPQVHTTQFFREHQVRFLPSHVTRTSWSWLRVSGKNSPEVRLLEQFKRIPTNTPVRKLIRKYLEFCWSLPYYGGAFFRGQVEQPVRGLTSLITHQDMPVLVAINAQGVYIIDDIQCTLLLGLKYEEMSWDFAKPSQEDNPDCLPCIFIQFMVLENGTRVSKVLQVFSKQAVMMDALISVFVEEQKQRTAAFADETDRPVYDTSTDSDDTQVPLTMVNRREMPQSCLSNKLSKLTLATFDDDGRVEIW